ncbi:MAG: LOG family protein, partial [Vicinamibacterales bacterium]|nr:LOG family protein [Vicinamibacterales bacterium]
TLDELFEILTWGQLGLHQKPCGLLNADGYFDRLLSFIDHSIDAGFVRPEYRRLIGVAESPDALIETLASYEPPLVETWLDTAAGEPR